MIVEDDEVDALNLPHTYGEDEIPLIFTDRAFNPDGTFLEFTNPQNARVRKGTHAIVNGVITPVHDTYAQVIRFRLLNASNARIYYFGLSDNRSFYQIGSDGGLLTEPISLQRLRLSTGERAEILIDFSADNGSSLKLMSYASELNALESPVAERPAGGRALCRHRVCRATERCIRSRWQSQSQSQSQSRGSASRRRRRI